MRVLLLALLFACAASVGEDRPNILLITCDNLGYGDLPCYRPESSIQAPNLDRLASEGARLTQFYTASPTCTVSRACLLTGRIPQRHGLTEQLGGIEGNYGVGLHQREILIPGILKTAQTPYATGCFGKWNIGFAPGSRPTERGFDEFLGHASGNIDYYHHRYNGERDLFLGIKPIIRDGLYATDLFADAAIDFFIRKSKEEAPWFCYLPFNSPHFPNKRNKLPGQSDEWQAPDWAFEVIGHSPGETDPKKRYDAVVFALDHAIGRVLDALEETGEAENTFLFFMSDNGGFRLNRKGLDIGINEPLRSGGVTCWEGGLRVPAIVRWPGEITPGTVVDAPLWSPDLLIACAKLAGADLPDGVAYDGKDPLPVLTRGAESPHDSFYFRYRTHAALRKGDWKMVREKPAHPWQLFDLSLDSAESEDLAAAKPGVLSELESCFSEWESQWK
ncbi:MAG: sulfatase-like hydrolase/transferase [Verrucomicrobiales bacterium]|nr:sulfatase-like hydrolase/transferase [Verrucomicrobiales bacterium]